MTLGLLAVMTMSPDSQKLRRIAGIALGVIAVVSAVMIFRASGGSESSAFRAFMASSYGVPVLMLISCGLVLMSGEDEGKGIAGMSAIQLFALLAFVMFILGAVLGRGSNVMMNIANASLVGFSLDKFSWWRYGRFIGLVLQSLAGIFVVFLAGAVLAPDNYLGMSGNRKTSYAIFIACLAILIVGIALISFML